MKKGGLGLQVFACYVPATLPPDRDFSFAMATIDRFEAEIEKHSQEIVLCHDNREIEAARDQGKIAAVLAIENGSAIEGKLENIELFYRRGVRLMTLIHSQSNDWVISSNDRTPAFDGLSEFGADVIRVMNDLGMIIDVSHAHDRAVERALELSRKPVVASHSCVHAICPVPRNLKDDQIRGIAEKGGLIGLNLFPGFLDIRYHEAAEELAGGLFSSLQKTEEQAGADGLKHAELWEKFSAEFGRVMSHHRVSLEKYFEHLDYIIDLVGDDHTAFGSDFDGIPDTPQGISDCRGFRQIREGLRERAMPEAILRKVCWSNIQRVFETVCG